MGQEVTYSIAFLAGVLSFFSPCILPMVPAYIMYMAGVNAEEDVKKLRLRVFVRTMAFVIGFTSIFLLMGATASTAGRFFVRNRDIFMRISGGFIVLFGLHLTGVLKISRLNRVVKAKGPKHVSSFAGSFLMGLAFASGWTPCFGPVLGSILFMAGTESTLSAGTALLGVYSLGMAIPFVLTAMFFGTATALIQKWERFIPGMVKGAGWVMIVFGLLIFFDKVIVISGWLIR